MFVVSYIIAVGVFTSKNMIVNMAEAFITPIFIAWWFLEGVELRGEIVFKL